MGAMDAGKAGHASGSKSQKPVQKAGGSQASRANNTPPQDEQSQDLMNPVDTFFSSDAPEFDDTQVPPSVSAHGSPRGAQRRQPDQAQGAQQGQAQSEGLDPRNTGMKFLYPDPTTEILHNDPDAVAKSGDGFTLNPKQQEELNTYGDKIKNVLAWNIMTQMLVKGSQMSLDSFLVGEKWQYEQQITVMQFMQTMAQMVLGYINNMSQGWDQLWTQYRQQKQELSQAEIKSYAGG